jgi:hypothetical protein
MTGAPKSFPILGVEIRPWRLIVGHVRLSGQRAGASPPVARPYWVGGCSTL